MSDRGLSVRFSRSMFAVASFIALAAVLVATGTGSAAGKGGAKAATRSAKSGSAAVTQLYPASSTDWTSALGDLAKFQVLITQPN